jgi:hypothetical protein
MPETTHLEFQADATVRRAGRSDALAAGQSARVGHCPQATAEKRRSETHGTLHVLHEGPEDIGPNVCSIRHVAVDFVQSTIM